MGEADRLLTVLTQEHGLIRAVAPGSRKHHSKLGGRSGLFVVNQLLIIKGRNLDKIIQAETIESYPGLSLDLGKLTASQYLAELVLFQALSNQPQEELFSLLNEHLSRLERSPKSSTLACLTQAIFHLLALAGVVPQVRSCCLTQQPLIPDFTDPGWRVGFSAVAGGTINLSALEKLEVQQHQLVRQQFSKAVVSPQSLTNARVSKTAEAANVGYGAVVHLQKLPELNAQLNAAELTLLQRLAQPGLEPTDAVVAENPEALSSPSDSIKIWLSVERVLRQYVQYHFDRPIRSAALIETCFLPLSTSP